jgi:hypothetical protein
MRKRLDIIDEARREERAKERKEVRKAFAAAQLSWQGKRAFCGLNRRKPRPVTLARHCLKD